MVFATDEIIAIGTMGQCIEIKLNQYSTTEVLAGITLHRNSQGMYGICNGRNHCNRDNGTMGQWDNGTMGIMGIMGIMGEKGEGKRKKEKGEGKRKKEKGEGRREKRTTKEMTSSAEEHRLLIRAKKKEI